MKKTTPTGFPQPATADLQGADIEAQDFPEELMKQAEEASRAFNAQAEEATRAMEAQLRGERKQ